MSPRNLAVLSVCFSARLEPLNIRGPGFCVSEKNFFSLSQKTRTPDKHAGKYISSFKDSSGVFSGATHLLLLTHLLQDNHINMVMISTQPTPPHYLFPSPIPLSPWAWLSQLFHLYKFRYARLEIFALYNLQQNLQAQSSQTLEQSHPHLPLH